MFSSERTGLKWEWGRESQPYQTRYLSCSHSNGQYLKSTIQRGLFSCSRRTKGGLSEKKNSPLCLTRRVFLFPSNEKTSTVGQKGSLYLTGHFLLLSFERTEPKREINNQLYPTRCVLLFWSNGQTSSLGQQGSLCRTRRVFFFLEQAHKLTVVQNNSLNQKGFSYSHRTGKASKYYIWPLAHQTSILLSRGLGFSRRGLGSTLWHPFEDTFAVTALWGDHI